MTLVHRGSDFRKLRERNRAKLAEPNTGTIRVMRGARMQLIRPESLIVEADSGTYEIGYQWVFVLSGVVSPESFLERAGVSIVERVIAA